MTINRKDGDRKDFNQSPDAYTALTGDYPTLYASRTIEEVFETAQRVYPKSIAYEKRWIDLSEVPLKNKPCAFRV
jgi:hypothetical protein